MTIQAALRAGIDRLEQAKIANAATDARRLLAAALVWDVHKVTLEGQSPMPQDAQAKFDAMIDRRIAHVPVSHLVGGRLFYGRWFTVTNAVLDPRPETETLIAVALEQPFRTVLDLGTGSGAIIVTLLAENTNASGLGTDISEQALAIASANGASLGHRVDFAQSDWFGAIAGTYDLIVSNPPYIAAAEMDALQPEVRLHEPRMALTDEGDGLGAYRVITAAAPAHLAPGGRLIVEIGPTQGQAVMALMRGAGLERIRVLPDLDGRDRVVVGHMPQ